MQIGKHNYERLLNSYQFPEISAHGKKKARLGRDGGRYW